MTRRLALAAVYPGNAQSQIDMGDNLGAKYYRKCRHPVQHNRSVSLGAQSNAAVIQRVGW